MTPFQTRSKSSWYFHQALLAEQLAAQADPEHHTAHPNLHESYTIGALVRTLNATVWRR